MDSRKRTPGAGLPQRDGFSGNLAFSRGQYASYRPRRPSAMGDRLILQAMYESGRTALAVCGDEMIQMVYCTKQHEGMLTSLEAAAIVAAYHSLLATPFFRIR